MNMFKRIASLLVVSLAVSCGGGGDVPYNNGSGGSSGGGNGGMSAATAMTLDVQRAGASTTQISSTETVQAVALVTLSGGIPVEGVVVTFSETQSTLLKFAPSARTALTDAGGKAVIDLGASIPSNTGATTVNATASIGAANVIATRAIQITAGAAPGGTTATPAAINFVGATPSGTAIVVKGAGGNGRSESAILTFRIVDASNAPINAVTVNFAINSSNGGATILQSSGVSNSDGLASTTVSSGTSPASIVVTATTVGAGGAIISSQSDTLIVSNSVPVDGGFEIVAEKYNLDGRRTGDSTNVTAYVRDKFGNPVPDGVAVNFITDYGVIAKSTVGGCTTTNGTCTVIFRVQDPRGAGVATITGTVRVGGGTELAQQLQINMAAATGSSYLALNPSIGLPIAQLVLASCKEANEYLLSDGAGRAPAAGTTILSSFASSNIAVSVKAGSPVLDQLAAGFPPVTFGIEIDLTSTSLIPACKPGGTVRPTSPATFFRLESKTPSGLVFSQRIELAYPQ